MSKYFKRNDDDFVPYYPEDLKKIREFLEQNGTLSCTNKQLDWFWSEFSDIRYAAGWMCVDDKLLEEFADWLQEYECED